MCIANGVDEEHVCSRSGFFIRHHRVLLNASFYLSIVLLLLLFLRMSEAAAAFAFQQEDHHRRRPFFKRRRFTYSVKKPRVKNISFMITIILIRVPPSVLVRVSSRPGLV